VPTRKREGEREERREGGRKRGKKEGGREGGQGGREDRRKKTHTHTHTKSSWLLPSCRIDSMQLTHSISIVWILSTFSKSLHYSLSSPHPLWPCIPQHQTTFFLP
jgi:hypothetical protein